MPYKRVGKIVYVKKDGERKKKATAGSVEKAKKMMKLLRGMEYGWEPRGKK